LLSAKLEGKPQGALGDPRELKRCKLDLAGQRTPHGTQDWQGISSYWPISKDAYGTNNCTRRPRDPNELIDGNFRNDTRCIGGIKWRSARCSCGCLPRALRTRSRGSWTRRA